METYRIEHVTFSYPNSDRKTLRDINLSIERGAFVTLCGPSGCGKTTLLRTLKPTISPHGETTGNIWFEGTPLNQLSPRAEASDIGFVLQSPENQIVTDKVWHELAFGLESLGLGTEEIRLRTAEMASFFGIQSWFHKSVTELSGGQKQLLALASIMAMQPRVLILDEPTSQLDPIAAGEFLAALGRINRDLGTTIILTEHRLEEALPLSTRAIAMEHGKIFADGTPQEVGLTLRGQNHDMFAAMPIPLRIWSAASGTGPAPITVRDGAKWLRTRTKPLAPLKLESKTPRNTQTAVTVSDVWFRYEKALPDVIKGLSFQANYGELCAILGGNGTGKSTTLGLIAGQLTPHRGKVRANDTVYALPQNPKSIFVTKTVQADLLEALSDQKSPKEQQEKRLTEITRLCRLEDLLNRHPYDLSGGEQQRAALAKVLLLQPNILLLDEPTKGLDAAYKQIFASILQSLTAEGVAIIMVSHDIEFCAEYTDRCALYFDGSIVTEHTPRQFFSGNSFYTTGTSRMARELLPAAVTASDLIQALGGTVPPPPARIEPERKPMSHTVSAPSPPSKSIRKRPPLPKRTLAAALMILVTIPLTIFAGIYLFDDRRFHFIALLIILQTMLPFALVFESRKPAARELIVIAVLCAIAVAGRSAFFMLPQFKPVIAVVIIAGVSFGGESGFLVGAMTGFVSNMFFGQGPWTPWQMFAFGIIGFLAGILFRKGLLSRSPSALAVFGGVTTLIIYGGILNPASVLMFQPSPTAQMFLISYLYGLPFDLIHAAASVIFLLILARPMLEKLDRIKAKYGLLE